MAIPSIRKALSRSEDTKNLGFIEALSGTWEGTGFNLIARPDKEGNNPLFLELNETFETLNIVPIASTIPNRGNVQSDVSLFGLTYLQKITDLVTKGALHIEPGIWIHLPSQDSADGQTQSVARMGNIPHGNSMLAQGTAIKLDLKGEPFDPTILSSVNTAPFPVGTPMPKPATRGAFPEYTLSVPTVFRTPKSEIPDPLQGVNLQSLVDNPTLLLTQALKGQKIGEMVVINIATVATIEQITSNVGVEPVTTKTITFADGGGGIENIPFLQENADVANVFATFWIETVLGDTPDDNFAQLQYVQTVLLNFPVIKPGDKPTSTDLSWPHVSVATLHKTFGGQ